MGVCHCSENILIEKVSSLKSLHQKRTNSQREIDQRIKNNIEKFYSFLIKVPMNTQSVDVTKYNNDKTQNEILNNTESKRESIFLNKQQCQKFMVTFNKLNNIYGDQLFSKFNYAVQFYINDYDFDCTKKWDPIQDPLSVQNFVLILTLTKIYQIFLSNVNEESANIDLGDITESVEHFAIWCQEEKTTITYDDYQNKLSQWIIKYVKEVKSV